MTVLKVKEWLIFSVVKRSKPFRKKSSNFELNYDDTDPDILIDCVISKILKTLNKSLVS